MKKPTSRGHLFRKYVVVLLVLVGGVLMASSLVELYFSYRETQRAIVRVERAKAVAAAAHIEQFLKEVEVQVRETTRTASDDPDASQVGPARLGFREGLGAALAEQRELDFLRVLRNVPAIGELSHLDLAGKEQLRVSRLDPDVVGSQEDFSRAPKFVAAGAGKTYWSPVYLKNEAEPYVTLAVPVGKYAIEVTTAEVGLAAVLKIVSQIEVGPGGYAYVVDSRNHLVAHPDGRVLRAQRDLSGLEQVKSARAERSGSSADSLVVVVADGLGGGRVLAAHAPIAPLGWLVFVERPAADAYAPLRAPIIRSAVIFVLGLGLSVLASILLARRMVAPIRLLQEGAARIGAGDLGHRIAVRTGDELEALGDELNRTAGQLEESRANLEQKVEERTRELAEANAGLTEALEQQTATSEILRVISSSPTDLTDVFTTIVANATRLCEAQLGNLFLYDADAFHAVAHHNASQPFVDILRGPLRPGPETGVQHWLSELRPFQIADVRLTRPYEASEPYAVVAADLEGIRTLLGVPLVKEHQPVGVITIYRREVRPFTDNQINLVKTFADQAVIAIENVRLFTELQEKNRALTEAHAHITEALEQQTATSEILRVIASSPTDVQPTFEAIARSARKLCEAAHGMVFRFDGELIHLAAHDNLEPEQLEAVRHIFPIPPGHQSVTARAILTGALVHVRDRHEDPDLDYSILSENFPTTLAVPLMRDGGAVGAITVTRAEVRLFSSRQVELLKTFADQAIIAIENVRLFTELQASNRELTTALDTQTATSDILRVISRSQADVQPVFDAIVASAVRLLGAYAGALTRIAGDQIALAALTSTDDAGDAALRASYPQSLHSEGTHAQAIRNRAPVNIADAPTDARVPETGHAYARARGYRSLGVVPMLRHDEAVGAISVTRREPGGFNDDEIALLQTFADQAVIAIENARLLSELQARTQELTRSVGELRALGEVGQAISSTLDLETVLTAIVDRAVELSGADSGSIFEYDETAEAFHLRVSNELQEVVVALRGTPLRKGEGATGRMAVTREPVQIPDIAVEGTYESRVREALLRSGRRAVLSVPLLREEHIIGGLVISRNAAGEFPGEVVELLKTFATQSALAIQNARLFQEIEEKSRELEAASRHKSEFLSNMSHELRTPLNAIIGFSEVLGDRMFGELTEKQEEYLKDIMESGQHLLSLINDILDLSKIEAGRMELELTEFDLPQAIDNALTLVRERAGRRGIALHQAVDERLGEIRGDERKVKQVLLNLLSNALKFTPEGGRIDVSARFQDGSAEISVTDTGVGIAPEDQEAVFEEFRQVGTAAKKVEGTGLGLALSRKFVELHGGRIWVQSEVGRGSTFTFTLPVRPGG
jgi:two-component system, NtrC family, sensor kinase